MKARLAVIVAVVGVTLAGCGDGGPPKGQVVAKVGKDEVTVIDLQAELGNFKAPDAKTRKAAEQQALNAIIQRKIIAQAARKQKIDKTPEFARQEERMTEVLLARTLQDQLVRAVPAPNSDEVQKFIAANPDLYSAHKRITIGGIRMAMPRDPRIVQGLQPLKTLDEVKVYLGAQKVAFQDGAGTLDALAVDPRLVSQLLKLPAGEVFVLPQGNAVMVGTVQQVQTDTVPNNVAVQHATQYLKSQRTQEALQRSFGQMVAAGRADVKYNKAYEPPKPPAKAAATPPAKAEANKTN